MKENIENIEKSKQGRVVCVESWLYFPVNENKL